MIALRRSDELLGKTMLDILDTKELFNNGFFINEIWPYFQTGLDRLEAKQVPSFG